MLASMIFLFVLGVALNITGVRLPYAYSSYVDIALARKFLGVLLQGLGLACFAIAFLLVVYRLFVG